MVKQKFKNKLLVNRIEFMAVIAIELSVSQIAMGLDVNQLGVGIKTNSLIFEYPKKLNILCKLFEI